MKLTIDIEGKLHFLLSALIGAYNRRTDVIQRASETDPALIKRLTDKLNADSDKLDAAIKQERGDM